MYIYDGSTEYWMKQWEEVRNDTRVSLMHFPPAEGSSTNANNEKARAYANCVGDHGKEHDALVVMDVNDFIVIPKHSSVEPLVKILDSNDACAHKFEQVLFGHGGQVRSTKFSFLLSALSFSYLSMLFFSVPSQMLHHQNLFDPLPVTKRFMLRVENETSHFVSSSLLLKTKSTTMGTDDLQTIEQDLIQYLDSGKFVSDKCIISPNTPGNIFAYHYLRSSKECNNEREDKAICNLTGSVEDQSAWDQMQSLVPWYANFNGLVY